MYKVIVLLFHMCSGSDRTCFAIPNLDFMSTSHFPSSLMINDHSTELLEMVNLLQCVTVYGYGYVVALCGHYLCLFK